MLKTDIRQRYAKMRSALTVMEKNKLDDLLLIEFQKNIDITPNCLLSYAPFENRLEFDPHLIERYCAFKNPVLTIAYPIIKTGDTLQAVAIDEQTVFSLNKYGISEPVDGVPVEDAEIDMVFVPLLAFDAKGYRVGYGKGYYDRFLSEQSHVLKIGFSYFDAVAMISDINEHDVPLDVCITPYQTYHFN
ncbi:MAG: 5-formyltetrahydrofolate cyclo-ligase [Ferruginibacter sp.]